MIVGSHILGCVVSGGYVNERTKYMFSQEQRCFIVKHYFLNQCSYTRTKIAFEEKWPEINLQKTLLRCVIIRFEQQHTVADLLNSGRLRVRITEFKQQVSTMLVATPHIWSHHLAQHTNTSHSTIYRTMRGTAYPYKVIACHELKPNDT